MTGPRQIDPYQVERLLEMSLKQKNLTEELRLAKDQIKLQCCENTSLFAFRLYTIYDATDMDYPDEEVWQIIHQYMAMKPLEPLDLHPLVTQKKEIKLSIK